MLVISLVINCVLTGIIIYMGVKTDYFNNIFKLNKKEQPKLVDINPINGWNNTLLKLGYNADVCFFGNSITYHSDFRHFFPQASICNLGCPGDDLQGMLLRIPAIQGVHPKKLFVMGGINDLMGEKGKELRMNYSILIAALCNSLPGTQIYLQSILPVNNEDFGHYMCDNSKIVEANGIIEEMAASNGVEYVNLYSVFEKEGKMPKELTFDGIHLNSDAYSLWANRIRSLIYQNNNVIYTNE